MKLRLTQLGRDMSTSQDRRPDTYTSALLLNYVPYYFFLGEGGGTEKKKKYNRRNSEEVQISSINKTRRCDVDTYVIDGWDKHKRLGG